MSIKPPSSTHSSLRGVANGQFFHKVCLHSHLLCWRCRCWADGVSHKSSRCTRTQTAWSPWGPPPPSWLKHKLSTHVRDTKDVNKPINTSCSYSVCLLLHFLPVTSLGCSVSVVSISWIQNLLQQIGRNIYTGRGRPMWLFQGRCRLSDIKKTEHRYLGLILICSKNENHCDTILTRPTIYWCSTPLKKQKPRKLLYVQ